MTWDELSTKLQKFGIVITPTELLVWHPMHVANAIAALNAWGDDILALDNGRAIRDVERLRMPEWLEQYDNPSQQQIDDAIKEARNTPDTDDIGSGWCPFVIGSKLWNAWCDTTPEENLPELTPEEITALEAKDMTRSLGTWEERYRVAMSAAVVYIRSVRELEAELETSNKAVESLAAKLTEATLLKRV